MCVDGQWMVDDLARVQKLFNLSGLQQALDAVWVPVERAQNELNKFKAHRLIEHSRLMLAISCAHEGMVTNFDKKLHPVEEVQSWVDGMDDHLTNLEHRLEYERQRANDISAEEPHVFCAIMGCELFLASTDLLDSDVYKIVLDYSDPRLQPGWTGPLLKPESQKLDLNIPAEAIQFWKERLERYQIAAMEEKARPKGSPKKKKNLRYLRLRVHEAEMKLQELGVEQLRRVK